MDSGTLRSKPIPTLRHQCSCHRFASTKPIPTGSRVTLAITVEILFCARIRWGKSQKFFRLLMVSVCLTSAPVSMNMADEHTQFLTASSSFLMASTVVSMPSTPAIRGASWFRSLLWVKSATVTSKSLTFAVWFMRSQKIIRIPVNQSTPLSQFPWTDAQRAMLSKSSRFLVDLTSSHRRP